VNKLLERGITCLLVIACLAPLELLATQNSNARKPALKLPEATEVPATEVPTITPSQTSRKTLVPSVTPTNAATVVKSNTATPMQIPSSFSPTTTPTNTTLSRELVSNLKKAAVSGAEITLILSGQGWQGGAPTEGYGCPFNCLQEYAFPQAYPPTTYSGPTAPLWCETNDELRVDLISGSTVTNLILLAPSAQEDVLQSANPIQVTVHIGDTIRYTYFHDGCDSTPDNTEFVDAALRAEINSVCFNGGLDIWDTNGNLIEGSFANDLPELWPIVTPSVGNPEIDPPIQYYCNNLPPGNCVYTASDPYVVNWVVALPTPTPTTTPYYSPTVTPTVTSTYACYTNVLMTPFASAAYTVIATCTMATTPTMTPTPSPTTTPTPLACSTCTNPVARLSQGDPRWKTKPISCSNPPLTIGAKGCLLTCAAMLGGSDPGTLNTVFGGKNYFVCGGTHNADLNFFGACAYFSRHWDGVEYEYNRTDATANQWMTDDLCNGVYLVADMTRANGSGHYVVVTGVTSDPNGCTFTIADPGNSHNATFDDYFNNGGDVNGIREIKLAP
jgi:hypothetical protein